MEQILANIFSYFSALNQRKNSAGAFVLELNFFRSHKKFTFLSFAGFELTRQRQTVWPHMLELKVAQKLPSVKWPQQFLLKMWRLKKAQKVTKYLS